MMRGITRFYVIFEDERMEIHLFCLEMVGSGSLVSGEKLQDEDSR